MPKNCPCGYKGSITSELISENLATFVPELVQARNQHAIDLLDVLYEQMMMWLSFGLLLKRQFLHMLYGLYRQILNRSLFTTPVSNSLVEIHPRALFALVIGAPQHGFREHGRSFLERNPAPIAGELSEMVVVPKEYAERILGTSRVSLKKLIRDGHIHQSRYRTGVTLTSANQLLMALDRRPLDVSAGIRATLLRAGQLPASLSEVITRIKQGNTNNLGFDIRLGIDHLRIDEWTPVVPPGPAAQMTIPELCKLFDVNESAVRFLIWSGQLPAHKGTGLFACNWLVSQMDAMAFHRTFVFATALARSQNVSLRTFSAKLRTAGAAPVSGLDVDGCPTYLFRRDDISKIDLVGVGHLQKYSTKAGRRRKS